MKTSLLFASLVSLAVLHAARATMIRADYLPIGDVRTDAIITKVIMAHKNSLRSAWSRFISFFNKRAQLL